MFYPSLKSLTLVLAIALTLSYITPPLQAKSAGQDQDKIVEGQGGGIWRRAVEEDHHSDDDHHDHTETESQASCTVTDHVLAHEFTELAEELGLTDGDGELCHVEEEGGDEHGHMDEGDEHMEEHGEHDIANITSNFTCSSCGAIYGFVKELLLHLNVTTPCCLGNKTVCDMHVDPETETDRRTDPAKAYGYGFLMVMLVCACSLFGVILIPLLNKENKFHGLYKYIYALMIALGTSALFCDAILHLIPEAFGLHDHGAGDSHAHEEEGGEEDKSFIWKGIIIIVGLYVFYLFEVTLHSWSSHTHHHHHELSKFESDSDVDTNLGDGSPSVSNKKPLTDAPRSSPTPCREPTLPHGLCHDKSPEDIGKGGAILHPGQPSCACEENEATQPTEKSTDEKANCGGCRGCLNKIKPLAWVIILGDAIHNFADGLALGAAISQSLSLGISTAIAIVFHELPHEFGDFAILLSTGLKWYIALLFNFVSSITAVIGFFVGMAVGTSTSEANGWILAAAAGVFLYIALVDLLPELIHIKEKGYIRLGLVIMANIGFLISFVVLLLIAIYEEDLNTLVTVKE